MQGFHYNFIMESRKRKAISLGKSFVSGDKSSMIGEFKEVVVVVVSLQFFRYYRPVLQALQANFTALTAQVLNSYCSK